MNRKKYFIKRIFNFFILIGLLVFSYIITNTNIFFKSHDSRDLNMLMNQNKSEKEYGHKIQIEIQNGCGDKGIATLFTNFLRTEGFDVIGYKNANSFNYDKTILKIHKKNSTVFVNEIVNTLNIEPSQLEYDFDKNIFYEMTLIIGNDYKSLKSYSEISMHYDPF